MYDDDEDDEGEERDEARVGEGLFCFNVEEGELELAAL